MKKFAIYLFACMLISMGVDAQELKVFEEWATSSGTQNMFLETFTETNASGGVYIGGATLNSNGEYDILLMALENKYNFC